MPGSPFGPMRPNTLAGLPLTARVLVPAVRRSSAVRGSGAAAARSFVRKGIVPTMATLDARICRRVRSAGLSFSLIAACPFRSRSEISHPFDLTLVRACCVGRVIAVYIERRRRHGTSIWIALVVSIKTIFIAFDSKALTGTGAADDGIDPTCAQHGVR